MNRTAPALRRSIAYGALCSVIGSACAGGDWADAMYTPRYRATVCRWESDPAIRCGYLDVPERRDAPEGRQIALYVERVAPRDPPSEPLAPILYLHGGPGYVPPTRSFLDSPLRERREIVLLTQRGVGYSEPKLACGEFEAWHEEAIAYGTGDPRDVEAAVEAAAACRRRLESRGIDLSEYDTLQAAHDVEDLRIALEIAEWNLYGASYGSRLALQVMRAHPHGVRSAILAGTFPPQVDFHAELAPNVERVFGKVFDACAEDPGCPTPGGLEDLQRIAAALDEAPRDVEVEGEERGERVTRVVRVDGGKVARMLFRMLYSTEEITSMPAILAHIEFNPELLVANPFGGIELFTRTPSDGLFLSVDCREEVAYTERARAADVAPYLRWFSLNWDAQDEQCAVWGAGRAPESVRAKVESDIPTLLIAGEFDPVTPVEWADLAAESLSNARVVEVPGAGHDASLLPCADSLMESFLDDLALRDDAECPLAEPLDFGD